MRKMSHFKWPEFSDGKHARLLMPLSILVVCLLSIVVGFFTTFPDSALRERILSEVNQLLPSGNRVEADSISLVFPLQVRLAGLRLIMKKAAVPEVSLETVAVSPTLATLIGRPGLDVTAQSQFGALQGVLNKSGEVDLHLREGRFELPIPEMTQLQLSGNISSVDLVGQLYAEKGESIRFDAELGALFLTGAASLGLNQDRLALGTLSATLSGKGRSLQIDKLTLDGGVVSLTGTGRIILQQQLGASRLDLTVQVRPGAGADENIRTLLDLLGPVDPDGSHKLQLRGRMMAPQLR